MIRTQIQLPEILYKEVQRVAATQEWSIAEVIRRGAESVVRAYPALKQKPASEGFARRHIIDVRLAKTLQAHGVKEFATENTRDFEGLGFQRVWNPLTP
jgi:hypothetical protein